MQNRRTFLLSAGAIVAPAVIGLSSKFAIAKPLPVEPVTQTPFKLGSESHARSSLSLIENVAASAEFTLDGRVKNIKGDALSDVLLYVWHTDEKGVYDASQKKFHGAVLTDTRGRFDLTSIFANGYEKDATMRRGHIHLVAAAPGQTPVASELFFNLESHRAISDKDFNPALELQLKSQNRSHALAEFDIIL